jgi:hypothetical protein
MGAEGKIVEFDHVIIICKTCHAERTVYPDRPLRGSKELIAFTKDPKYMTRCGCGGTHCDIKAHMVGDPCVICWEKRADAPGEGCTQPEFHEAKRATVLKP